jgi:uncharacterized protein YqeY
MIDKIKKDLQEAQKARDALKISTLRFLLAAIKNLEIEKGGAGYKAGDEDILSAINKQVKQRKESIEQFKEGGRKDLAEKESQELKILESYLPEQMNEEDTRQLVSQTIKEVGATSPGDIGKVMGAISQKVKGKADMGLVSSIVRERLS